METKKKTAATKATSAKKSEAKDLSSIPLFDIKGKEVGKLDLNKDLFTGEVNKAVLYQAVLMYNANQRRGTASTKTRGDVSGGGKKPWRQKGTGRARAGSTRSPLWRHGGTVFGPHPRDFHYALPKKVLRVALLSSLNARLVENKLIGIEAFDLKEAKTKAFQGIVDALKLSGKSLFVLDPIGDSIKKASRNIEGIAVKNPNEFTALDVLSSKNIVISKPAFAKLSERLVK